MSRVKTLLIRIVASFVPTIIFKLIQSSLNRIRLDWISNLISLGVDSQGFLGIPEGFFKGNLAAEEG